jgi:hypothetical protein
MTMDNFAKHVARYYQADLGGRMEKIVFSQPGNSNYYIEFVSYRGILVVTGDLYDAIYEVSQPQTMQWWGHTDASYMNGKMRGPNGYSNERKVWDSDEAEKDLKELYAELVKEARQSDEEIPQQDGPEWDAWVKSLDDLDQATMESEVNAIRAWHELEPRDHLDEHDWMEFCREHAEEIWGQDWYETGASRLGMIENPICATHLEALQKALAQLKEKGIQVYQEKAEPTKW